MNFAINRFLKHDNTLIWAVICSILLHGLLAAFIPNLKFDAVKTPDILEVELVSKPEPPPVAQPEPVQPQPEPIQPPPVVKPKPLPKPKPRVEPTPAPVIEKSEPITEPPTPVAPPPETIAVAPQAEAEPPTFTVPTPVPVVQEPSPPVPSQPDINAARAQYGNALFNAISKHKKYPRIAQMRSWEGEAVVELVLDNNGKIKSKKIEKSSGHEVLDKAALEMVEKASPFPVPPEVLRNGDITITVPVPFKLAKS